MGSKPTSRAPSRLARPTMLVSALRKRYLTAVLAVLDVPTTPVLCGRALLEETCAAMILNAAVGLVVRKEHVSTTYITFYFRLHMDGINQCILVLRGLAQPSNI